MVVYIKNNFEFQGRKYRNIKNTYVPLRTTFERFLWNRLLYSCFFSVENFLCSDKESICLLWIMVTGKIQGVLNIVSFDLWIKHLLRYFNITDKCDKVLTKESSSLCQYFVFLAVSDIFHWLSEQTLNIPGNHSPLLKTLRSPE